MENGFSHTIWTLRIESDAIWISQCTYHVPSQDEDYLGRIPRTWSYSIFG